MIRRLFLGLAAASLLGACATAGTLAARPLDSGTAMAFPSPAPRVVEAAKQTLLALSMGASSVTEQSGSTVLNFQKSMTAFSYGEVGRIVVTPTGEATSNVYVDTEKMYQIQITGTDEASFSRDIFAGIKERLAH